MDLASVVINDNFNDYLEGKEVKAAFIVQSTEHALPGERVMAFKDVVAKDTASVPKSQQAHFIGIEGKITEVVNDGSKVTQFVKVVKV